MKFNYFSKYLSKEYCAQFQNIIESDLIWKNFGKNFYRMKSKKRKYLRNIFILGLILWFWMSLTEEWNIFFFLLWWQIISFLSFFWLFMFASSDWNWIEINKNLKTELQNIFLIFKVMLI